MMKFLFPKRHILNKKRKANNGRIEDDATASTASVCSSQEESEARAFFSVDMKLGPEYPPLEATEFSNLWTPQSLEEHMQAKATKAIEFEVRWAERMGNNPPKSETFAVGSSSSLVDRIFFKQDTGLFQCVHQAWMNHWNLRTSPEDWWHPVACRIAKAVADAAKGDDMGGVSARSKKIRDFFVSHQGQQTLNVVVGAKYLEEADYKDIFQQFSQHLENRIKVPEYANVMQNDFGTTSAPHKIASQINLMSSLQEFFKYRIVYMGCGIKAVEMYGEEDDWDHLVEKLTTLKTILEPILGDLWIPDGWWDSAAGVFQNLALTRKDPNNPEVIDFWSKVLTQAKQLEPGGFYGMGFGKKHVDAYDGWLIQFLTGQKLMRRMDLNQESLSGLNQVPVALNMAWCNPPIEEEVKMVAGTMGFELHPGNSTSNGIPSLQPVHAWAMMLPPDSKIPLLRPLSRPSVPASKLPKLQTQEADELSKLEAELAGL